MKYLVEANVLSEPTKPTPDPRVMAWFRAHERARHLRERTQTLSGHAERDRRRSDHTTGQHGDDQNTKLDGKSLVFRTVLRHLDGVSAAGGLFIYRD